MTAPLPRTQLDAELERIAGLSGKAREDAAVALVEAEVSRVGGTAGMHCHAIHGRDLTLRVVRLEGVLRLQTLVRVDAGGRWG